MAKWWVGGWEHVVHFAEAEVRVGGKYRVGFAPPGQAPYIESGTYSEIVPMKRLAYRETVVRGGEAWRNAGGWVPALEKLAAHLE